MDPINPIAGNPEALQQTAPLPKKPFSILHILLVLLSLLVLLLLLTSSYFAYHYVQLKQQASIITYEACIAAPGSTLQESYPATCVTRDGKRFTQPLTDEQKKSLLPPNPTITAPTVALKDWKTYSDNQYGFSFHYKSGGTLTEGSNPTQEKILRIIYGNDTLELFVQSNNQNLPLDEYIQQFGGDYPGKSAYKGTLTDNKHIGILIGTYIVFPTATKSKFDMSGVSQHFYFQKDKKVFWLRLMQSKDQLSDDDKLYFTQILSTFTFTNSSSIPVTKERAVQLVQSLGEVKKYLVTVPNAIVEFDHESEDQTAWVIHVYEVKNDHTATFNWFDVNRQSGQIMKEFN